MEERENICQLPGPLLDGPHLQSLSLPDVFSAILSTASTIMRMQPVSNCAKYNIEIRFPWQQTSRINIHVVIFLNERSIMEKGFGARGKELWGEPGGLDGECLPGDFLQDPELWRDRLPQPFRMIDRLLEELLVRTWEEVDSRRLEREGRPAAIPCPEPVQLDRYLPQNIVKPEENNTGNLMDNLQLRLAEFNTKL